MYTSRKEASLISSILLISGCCVGAGMLGLPVVSAMAGFMPSIVATLIAYLFAVITGLLLVEASLWFNHKVHLISLAEQMLGRIGKTVVWTFFLFLFYCLFVAYLSGGGELFSAFFSACFNMNISQGSGSLLCALTVFVIIYMGTHFVTKISQAFFLAVALSYSCLVATSIFDVKLQALSHVSWVHSFATIPILFICFGYQNLIPTVIDYVHGNIKKIRLSIIVGNLIPFVIYSLWNFVILGVLSDSNIGNIVDQGEMVTTLIQKNAGQQVRFFVNIFSFFSIITPFLASSLAFVHFLQDGLKNTAFYNQKAIVYGLAIIPPVLFTLFKPGLFLSALSFAGGFVDAVLFGIMPVLIVYSGRYRRKMVGPYQVFGGRFLLTIVFVFSLAVLIYRLINMFF